MRAFRRPLSYATTFPAGAYGCLCFTVGSRAVTLLRVPVDRPRPADEPDPAPDIHRRVVDSPALEHRSGISFADGVHEHPRELDSTPDAPRSAWHRPGVVDHPDRPRIDSIRLAPDRLAHILDGDERGGGHRHGADIPGNSEFSESWDDDKIAATVLRAAYRPQDVEQQANGRWRVSGIYDDVDLRVAVNPDGRVWTAYPIAGPGVRTNPD